MKLFSIVWDAIRPGSPKFKAQLNLLTEEQARITRALHLLDSHATQDVRTATDRAGEFK